MELSGFLQQKPPVFMKGSAVKGCAEFVATVSVVQNPQKPSHLPNTIVIYCRLV